MLFIKNMNIIAVGRVSMYINFQENEVMSSLHSCPPVSHLLMENLDTSPSQIKIILCDF